jgi:hypothetical protein
LQAARPKPTNRAAEEARCTGSSPAGAAYGHRFVAITTEAGPDDPVASVVAQALQFPVGPQALKCALSGGSDAADRQAELSGNLAIPVAGAFLGLRAGQAGPDAGGSAAARSAPAG